MVCRGVNETTDIQCDPTLRKKIKERPDKYPEAPKEKTDKELKYWPNEDGVKNALWLISTDSTKYCYGEKVDYKWQLSAKPIEYRTDAKSMRVVDPTDPADTKSFLHSGPRSGHWGGLGKSVKAEYDW